MILGMRTTKGLYCFKTSTWYQHFVARRDPLSDTHFVCWPRLPRLLANDRKSSALLPPRVIRDTIPKSVRFGSVHLLYGGGVERVEGWRVEWWSGGGEWRGGALGVGEG